MKTILVVIAAFGLLGCTNGKKVQIQSPVTVATEEGTFSFIPPGPPLPPRQAIRLK